MPNVSGLDDVPVEYVNHPSTCGRIEKKVMIRNGAVPNLTNFSQATFKPNQVAAEHSHKDMWEVFFCERGTGQIKVDNDKIYVLKPGVCITIIPHELHEVSNTGNDDLVLTYFGIASPP
mmetsp:Transcript_21055/g.34776  ORF Transcript_21055/g.34776 Transcript_21055/m.34776 type:complete len:119 (-) Transcript_21055:42-398(-)|eukprot:CAMPEP_0184661100 /NCGR_PEP_ID=MMETSP0308-20130426/36994_1 /TAXON_ID=38269 /ORGANISM="Gloeochaete witrockiana, Strain SAG 46.84" /LENGTH=118 /DNA_ID=CAMNT_0027102185 /DNA_START=83 /DNA_END=439 /DNA_ORIENTATION=-